MDSIFGSSASHHEQITTRNAGTPAGLSTSSGTSDRNESGPKPVFLNKIEANPGYVNDLVILKGDEGVITVGDDKTIRVWLKRDNGGYWPSICHTMPSSCVCVDFHQQTYRLFVGCDNGVISEFTVADDFNKLIHRRDYFAHAGSVTAVRFSLEGRLLLSVGKDRQFVWQCAETGQRFGSFNVGAPCTSLQYDNSAKYAFVGDSVGNVHVLRLRENMCELVSSDLKAHTGYVSSLEWEPERQLLFSGAYDRLIIVWDVGGRQGNAYELLAHKSKITALAYANGVRKLFSVNNTGSLVVWDMNAKRTMTPEWLSSDICERCDAPFFWNVKEMWTKRVIGLRQHHCRTCGKAVCDKCSRNRMTYPPMGYEIEVRICDGCFGELNNRSFDSLAAFSELQHSVIGMKLDELHGRLVTVGDDRIIKIWDVKDMLR